MPVLTRSQGIDMIRHFESRMQSPAPTVDELIKKIAVGFFYHWWNTAGTNTDQGFDEWWKNHKQEYFSSKATKQTEK